MSIDVGLQFEEIEREFHLLPEQMNQAIMKALNKTAEFLKRRLTKEIASHERIKLKTIRDRIKIFRAKKMKLSSMLDCNFSGIPVTVLGTPYQTKPGAMIGNRLFKGAFVAFLKKDGTAGVYRRKTKARFPLKKERLDRELYNYATKIMSDLVGENYDESVWNIFESTFFQELENITGVML